MSEPFTDALNRFCAGLSEKICILADDPDGTEIVVETLLTTIREAIAQLLLCELECERLLARRA